MKKRFLAIFIIMIFLMCFSLYSCDNGEASSKGEGSSAEHQAQSESLSASVAESYEQSSEEQSSEQSQIESESEEQNDESSKVNLTVAEKRSIKVSFNFQHQDLEAEPVFLAKNEDENSYVAYAPNLYEYYALVQCTATADADDEMLGLQYTSTGAAREQMYLLEIKYFSGGANGCKINVDVVDLSDDTVMIVFPDFDSYALCQEELLNNLSSLDTVEKISVGYINSQNGSKAPTNTYEYENFYYLFDEHHKFFASYEDFVATFGSKIESSEKLQKITERTFEENYVFAVYNSHYDKFEISDASLVGDTVYFTINGYVKKGVLYDAIAHHNDCITIVPKSELGELPQEIKIETVRVFIYY